MKPEADDANDENKARTEGKRSRSLKKEKEGEG